MNNYRHLLHALMGLILGCLICSLFGSCRSMQCPDITEDMFIHDTIQTTRLHHDSIHVLDSIYLREYVKGDTVYLEHYRWRTKYKEVLRIDTIYQTKVQDRTVKVEVERQLTTWQKLRLHLGDLLLLSLLVALAYFAYKIYRRIA